MVAALATLRSLDLTLEGNSGTEYELTVFRSGFLACFLPCDGLCFLAAFLGVQCAIEGVFDLFEERFRGAGPAGVGWAVEPRSTRGARSDFGGGAVGGKRRFVAPLQGALFGGSYSWGVAPGYRV